MLLYATQTKIKTIGESNFRINEDFMKYEQSNFKFDRNGKFGIKTTVEPTHDLEINGNGLITDGITIGGPLKASGGITGTHIELSGDLQLGDGLVLSSLGSEPVSTSNKLYNLNGTLYFSGSAVGGGGASNLSDLTIDTSLDMGTYNITNANELTINQALELTSHTPSTTTNKLYNVNGSLYWYGTRISHKQYMSFSMSFTFVSQEDGYHGWWTDRSVAKFLLRNSSSVTRSSSYVDHYSTIATNTNYFHNGIFVTADSSSGYIDGFEVGEKYKITYNVNIHGPFGYPASNQNGTPYAFLNYFDGIFNRSVAYSYGNAEDSNGDNGGLSLSFTYYFTCISSSAKIYPIYNPGGIRTWDFGDKCHNFRFDVIQIS